VAVILYRLGRFSFRNRWLMLGLWVVMLIGAGIAGTTLAGQTTSSFSVPGTPSQEALDLMEERAGGLSEGGTRARFVFAAPEGERIDQPEYVAAIEEALAEIAAWPGNIEEIYPDHEGGELDDRQAPAEVRNPFDVGLVSPNGQIAIGQVLFSVQAFDLVEETREFLVEAGDPAREAGLQVEVGGDALQPPVEQGLTELIGVAVAAVVLTITFGSLVAAGLPLLMAFVGIGIGISLITAATGFIDMSAESSILAMMLGLAVAIDYSLFIVSRHRLEFAKGKSLEEAAGTAVGTAGNAVAFAGLTVIIALAGLSVVGIPFLTEMALSAVVTVLFAILIAVSLLPAVLGFAGRRVLSRKVRKGAEPFSHPTDRTLGTRWGRFVTSNPIAVLLVSIVGLGVLAIPAFDMELGIPGDEAAAEDSTQRQAYDLIAENFGPGFNGPLQIVLDVEEGTDVEAAVQGVQAELSAMDRIADVQPIAVIPETNFAVLQATPTTAPSSTATSDLVQDIRDDSGRILEATGADIGVTGLTAFMIDVSDRLAEAMTPYLIVVVGLALILLLLVFRSVAVPVKATLGFLLTIGATFGAVVAVFQWGWMAELFAVDQVGPILSFLPIFMIGVVFGLAMDYEFFLVTRMREEYVHGAEPKEAIIGGLGFSGRIVTAAAIIMISVFMGFVISDNAIIKSIGFAMAVGVAVDAFVVRITIVPAVLAMLGRAAWWIPRWLNAILPNVDVEGERLRKHIGDGAEPNAKPAPAE